jgi:hypothetical protein
MSYGAKVSVPSVNIIATKIKSKLLVADRTFFSVIRRYKEIKEQHRGIGAEVVHTKKEPGISNDKKPKGKSNSDPLVIDSEDELGKNTSGLEAESEDEESPDEEEESDDEEENGEDEDSHESDEEMDSNENGNVFYNLFNNIVNESAWFEQGAITSIQSD